MRRGSTYRRTGLASFSLLSQNTRTSREERKRESKKRESPTPRERPMYVQYSALSLLSQPPNTQPAGTPGTTPVLSTTHLLIPRMMQQTAGLLSAQREKIDESMNNNSPSLVPRESVLDPTSWYQQLVNSSLQSHHSKLGLLKICIISFSRTS